MLPSDMLPVRFHPEAWEDMVESARFYERQTDQLGKRFLDAVNTATRHIQLNPEIYADILPGRKSCRVRNFPFKVICRQTDSRIEMVAVAHDRRNPNYWEAR